MTCCDTATAAERKRWARYLRRAANKLVRARVLAKRLGPRRADIWALAIGELMAAADAVEPMGGKRR